MDKNVIIGFPYEGQLKYMDILPYKPYLKETLTLSLERCMKSVDAGRGSIFLVDSNRNELVLGVAKASSGIDLENVRTPLGERVAGKVALERKPFLVKNIDEEIRFPLEPRYDDYNSKSFVSVPLEFSGDLIGVVNVTDKTKGEVFDGEDLDTVLSICKYLGITIYSLRRFLEKQRKINEKLSNEVDTLRKEIKSSKKYSSLGKIVGGLVHEINNPLDGAIRYVNLAFDSVDEDSVASSYLHEAKEGLGRIAKIVRSLLDFSWSLSPQARKIDVNQTIEESLFMFNHYFVFSNIEVRKFFTYGLPKIPDLRLKIALNNIIKNACEEMKDKGVLSIYTALNNGAIEIKIKDTGRGIPRQVQDKIFEPFFTTKSMGEGSGLGLAITYEIITRYKGNIYIDSTQGEGTTFNIRLPL
ncbi:MAG: hypothetical protein B1H08_05125 [Candidatus Omnitrophica bacterium 4484_171]|nr:MAG: hypothetical protein B1H08_05125 [Candidatus Omnitrophica bacterium 4484_171]